MGEKNILLRNVCIGAAAGFVLSMFHKPTRESMIEEAREISEKASYYYHNPSLLSEDLKAKLNDAKDMVQNVTDDLRFVNEKVNELKETTPVVIEAIKEAKERIISSKTD
ncbi:YtxH domain-containing protein [Metabacillus sp. KIGAM252]|uniref:YtxH domain-containing protein n=1 Tax=Metabacillus flavus TaxID=2823519 RepID=A0ABS5LAL6_9BACI|nr:YtxH domain-containing protein [Metabacillus flavus]MBS2967756.1 YtxH domain-containing protein [Metabacillus flavus]